jgi:predicted methyltransferase
MHSKSHLSSMRHLTCLLVALIWGTTWTAIKLSLEGYPPVIGATLRFVFAIAMLGLYARVTRLSLLLPRHTIAWVAVTASVSSSLSSIRWWPLSTTLPVLYLGLVGSAAAFVMHYSLLKTMRARTLSMISYVTPLVAVFSGWILLNESIRLRVGSGVVAILRRSFQWPLPKLSRSVETSADKTHAIEAYVRVLPRVLRRVFRNMQAIHIALLESVLLNAYATKSSRLIDEGRKVRSLFPIAAAFFFLGCATTSAQNAVPPYIASAVANQDRPDEDRQRDADRKPAEVLTFVGIKNGEKVADLIPGTGYFSRILSSAVGPHGHVYGFFPSELANFIKRPLPPNGSTPYPEFKNVSVIAAPVNDFAAPEPLDLVWISLNYHDLHDPFFAPADPAKINKAVFAALKPGGRYVVIDHAAVAGSGLRDTNTLHRIDEASVKSEVEAAGFSLEGESDLLHNTDDPRTANVKDPTIRGKTDQFILKFRKPKQ